MFTYRLKEQVSATLFLVFGHQGSRVRARTQRFGRGGGDCGIRRARRGRVLAERPPRSPYSLLVFVHAQALQLWHRKHTQSVELLERDTHATVAIKTG